MTFQRPSSKVCSRGEINFVEKACTIGIFIYNNQSGIIIEDWVFSRTNATLPVAQPDYICHTHA